MFESGPRYGSDLWKDRALIRRRERFRAPPLPPPLNGMAHMPPRRRALPSEKRMTCADSLVCAVSSGRGDRDEGLMVSRRVRDACSCPEQKKIGHESRRSDACFGSRRRGVRLPGARPEISRALGRTERRLAFTQEAGVQLPQCPPCQGGEMVDALGSEPSGRDPVQVRLLSLALRYGGEMVDALARGASGREAVRVRLPPVALRRP